MTDITSGPVRFLAEGLQAGLQGLAFQVGPVDRWGRAVDGVFQEACAQFRGTGYEVRLRGTNQQQGIFSLSVHLRGVSLGLGGSSLVVTQELRGLMVSIKQSELDLLLPRLLRWLVQALPEGSRHPQADEALNCLRSEENRARENAEQVKDLIALAREHGWNGVENSKILSVFFRDLLGSRGGDDG